MIRNIIVSIFIAAAVALIFFFVGAVMFYLVKLVKLGLL